MNERGCYCEGMSAEFRREHNLPDGYCGTCIRCGKPGHTRHHPGPVPFTGAWCDRCYRIEAWTWPFKTPQGWVLLAVVGAILYVAVKALIR
jgi:hypothetical protein